jgi:hypothetical protein
MALQTLDEAKVAEAAYFLWLEEGQPEGRAEAHWERATELLCATPAKARKPRAKAAPKAKPAKRAAAAEAAPAKKTTRARKTAAKTA